MSRSKVRLRSATTVAFPWPIFSVRPIGDTAEWRRHVIAEIVDANSADRRQRFRLCVWSRLKPFLVVFWGIPPVVRLLFVFSLCCKPSGVHLSLFLYCTITLPPSLSPRLFLCRIEAGPGRKVWFRAMPLQWFALIVAEADGFFCP